MANALAGAPALGLRPPKNTRRAEQAKPRAEARMRNLGLKAKMTNSGTKIVKKTDEQTSADGEQLACMPPVWVLPTLAHAARSACQTRTRTTAATPSGPRATPGTKQSPAMSLVSG